jgi:plasmid rolling circle replication initiator protein Rep
MSTAWRRLFQRQEFKPVLGWTKALEITKNHKTGFAHPHIHALLMVKPSYFTPGYVSQAKWTELWRESLRIDYTPVVHVKAIKDNPQALKTAVFEVFKYALKPGDLADDKEWFLACMGQICKKRLVSTGGVLKGILR